jgi:para-nitrobenzyl esterase
VSANYRTGFEGFARLESAPDNRALLDQIAALRWVQDNITTFGGNPDNVTVMGQSAGAGSIAALLVMPSTAGLFRRAILQSVPGTFFTPALATDIAAEISAELGRPPRAKDLVDVEPGALVEAARSVIARLPQYEHRWGPVVHTTTPFSPVVDGEILPRSPWSAPAAASGVDLLIGHTRDEFILFAAALDDIDDAGADALLGGLSPTPGAQRYRAAYPSLGPNQLRETALSDWLFRMPTLHFAEAAQAGGARVWLYELRWGFGAQGASHGLDTLLVFGTTDITGEVAALGPAAVARTRQLSQLMRTEHLAFAATGDPGWARFRPDERDTRVYADESRVERYPEERSRVLWRDQQFGVLDLLG